MSIIFFSFKHPKLPISIEIPVTLLQNVYIRMTAKFEFMNYLFANLLDAWLKYPNIHYFDHLFSGTHVLKSSTTQLFLHIRKKTSRKRRLATRNHLFPDMTFCVTSRRIISEVLGIVGSRGIPACFVMIGHL